MNIKNVIERLKKISLFNAIKDNDEILKKVATIIKVEKFPANSYIIKEGQEGDKMYILNKGSARVEKNTLSKDKFIVSNLRDDMNIFFGEVSLMDNDLRSASIYTITDAECFIITKDDFDKFCEENPHIGYHITKEIAKLLSSRLRRISGDNMILIEALVKGEDSIF